MFHFGAPRRRLITLIPACWAPNLWTITFHGATDFVRVICQLIQTVRPTDHSFAHFRPIRAHSPKGALKSRPSGTIQLRPSFLSPQEVTMRHPFFILLVSLAFVAPMGLSDSELRVKDLQNHPFAVDFPAGSKLRLHLRSGEFRIVGHKDNKIAVHLAGRNADHARELTVQFRRWGNDADLRISGGPKNDLTVTVETPTSAMLFTRMPAGDLAG